MKTKFYKYFNFAIILSVFLTPVLVFGFSLKASTFRSFILYILSIIYVLIPILFALAFIFFFWGLSKFILNSGSKTDIDNGKNYMIWGIVILFVLISFRTIIGLISKELEIGDGGSVPILKTSEFTSF